MTKPKETLLLRDQQVTTNHTTISTLPLPVLWLSSCFVVVIIMAKTRQTAARSSGADPYAPSRKRRPAQAAKKKSKKKGEEKKQKVPPVASALSKFIVHLGGSDSDEESSLPSQAQTRNNTTRMKSLPPVDTMTHPQPKPLPPKSILEEVFIPPSLLSEVEDALMQLRQQEAAKNLPPHFQRVTSSGTSSGTAQQQREEPST